MNLKSLFKQQHPKVQHDEESYLRFSFKKSRLQSARTRSVYVFVCVGVRVCDQKIGWRRPLCRVCYKLSYFPPEMRFVLTFAFIFTVASDVFPSSFFPLCKSFSVRLHSLCRSRSRKTHLGFKSGQHRPVI